MGWLFQKIDSLHSSNFLKLCVTNEVGFGFFAIAWVFNALKEECNEVRFTMYE